MNLLRGYGRQPNTPQRRLREFNDCNLPKGDSDGGRFGRNDDPRCGPQGGTPHGPPRPDLQDKIGMADARRADAQRRWSDAPAGSEAEATADAERQAARLRVGELQAQQRRKTDAQTDTQQTLDRVAGDLKNAALRAQGIAPPELSSQDTKKSDTKQTQYSEENNIDGISGPRGLSIFNGLTNEDIAREMTKYISETMDVRINDDGADDDSEDVNAGPDPDDRDVKRAFERHNDNQMSEASDKHREELTDGFTEYATKAFIDTGMAGMKVMRAHAQYFLDNPEALPPPAVDPKQQAFDVDGDPTTTDFERPPSNELTPQRAIEILDKHGLLTRYPGTPDSDGDPISGLAAMERSLEYGDFVGHFKPNEVRDTLFNPEHERYNEPHVAAARAELLALTPMALQTQVTQAGPDAAPPPGYTDLIDEGTRDALRDAGGYLAQTAEQLADSERNEIASNWYDDTDQSDNADYDDVDSFETWYENQYGHPPSEWEDRVNGEYSSGDSGGSERSRGEVTFSFSGSEGSEATRVFTRDYNGDLTVYHSFFRNEGDPGQGKGMMRGQMELYERLGVSEVTTTANISTGSYAWARYGFQSASPSALASYLGARLDRMLSVAPGLSSVEGRVRELLEQHSDDPTLPWHMADLRVSGDPRELAALAEVFTTGHDNALPSIAGVDDPARWDASIRKDAANGTLNLGKILMTGLSWSARFDMNDGTMRARMRDYIGDWREPADGSTMPDAKKRPIPEQTPQVTGAWAKQAAAGNAPAETRAPKATPQAAAVAKAQKSRPTPTAPRSGPVTVDRARTTANSLMVPMTHLGNTAAEVMASRKVAKTNPVGTPVYRQTTRGTIVTGQVSHGGSGTTAERVITADKPTAAFGAHPNQYTGPWQVYDLGRTPRSNVTGTKVQNITKAAPGTKVKRDTNRGRLVGRVQGDLGDRGVNLITPPGAAMPKFLSGFTGPWRRK